MFYFYMNTLLLQPIEKKRKEKNNKIGGSVQPHSSTPRFPIHPASGVDATARVPVSGQAGGQMCARVWAGACRCRGVHMCRAGLCVGAWADVCVDEDYIGRGRDVVGARQAGSSDSVKIK